jgi:hypothetical protein
MRETQSFWNLLRVYRRALLGVTVLMAAAIRREP